MMKKRQIRKIAEQILEQEDIIANENSLDESIKSAQKKIEKLMSSLSFEDIILIDDYIMSKNIEAIKLTT